MKIKMFMALAAGLLSTAPAFATVVDFDTLTDYQFVDSYYNGGTSSLGQTGPNLGITFGSGANNSNALVLANGSGLTYFSNNASLAVMTPSALDPGSSVMNVAAGFSGDARLRYSSSAAVTINVFDGLNGSGQSVGSFTLLANAAGCDPDVAALCAWDTATAHLSGIAKSIVFDSAAGIAGFDDIDVAPVPLPAAAWLLLSGLGSVGAFARRRRQASAASA